MAPSSLEEVVVVVVAEVAALVVVVLEVVVEVVVVEEASNLVATSALPFSLVSATLKGKCGGRAASRRPPSLTSSIPRH